MSNPQIENLERVATLLAPLPDQFVFTGGATIVLYVDKMLWDDLRPTKDVDCVVEIASQVEYYALAERLVWDYGNVRNRMRHYAVGNIKTCLWISCPVMRGF
jgi:hypothetical protein